MNRIVNLKAQAWSAVEVACLAITGILIAAFLATAQNASPSGAEWNKALDDTRRLEHAANRLTFGANPATVAKIREMGIEQWIDWQLHPERIAESPVLSQKLAEYPALQMSSAQLAREYPNRQYLRQVSRGRADLPADPEKRQRVEAMAQANAERERAFVQQQTAGKAAPEAAMNESKTMTGADIRTMSSTERLIALAAMTREERQEAIRKLPARDRQELMANVRPAFTVNSSLIAGKVLRATYSERQLEELMTDFWFNHFNVSVQKEGDRYFTIPYERDVIRKHALGRFEDLLAATAQSPAMLFYLDNFQSISPDARLPRRMRQNGRAPRGLNENYARELMELHTLGVDGGYSQQDVTEVARCFTGWTIDMRVPGGGFRFVPQLHDSKTKTVLGKKIDGGGMRDGLEVLDLLASHPSTARFISAKLAQRFVADQPPATLIDAMAKAFQSSGGDIRQVLRTMFSSPEFWSEEAYRAKVKQPFEMVVSAARALQADVKQPLLLARAVDRLGQPLYRKQEPTGYSALNGEWVNSAALVERMNLALQLSASRMPGLRWQPEATSGDEMVEIARREWLLPVSDATVDSIRNAIADPEQTQLRQYRNARETQLWAGLLIGSPEFQRR